MANLIIPDRSLHKYVIGIDFGHGETSAAICELQWDTPEGKANIDASDIRINPTNTGNENVIVSAISIQRDSNSIHIGENAFEAENMSYNAMTRVCFKEAPQALTDGNRDIYNDQEHLMITFMSAVYQKIREIENSKLNDTNHLVYIARPSGWVDVAVKERYCEMALKAGIPLAGLTSESRAAIFYAIHHQKINFKNEVKDGAIVFDLGSSTLDLTYLKQGEKPIDFGYRECGASAIEKVIYDEKFATNDAVARLVRKYPKYEARLLFTARKIKEEAYKRDSGLSIDASFMLRTKISKELEEFDNLKKEFIEVEYSNIDEFNYSIENIAEYRTKLRNALEDFQKNHIADKPVKGIFLTGGASRMGFIPEIVREVFDLKADQVQIDPSNPSLTVSRGIAQIGRADCIANGLISGILSRVTDNAVASVYDDVKSGLASSISYGAWCEIESETKRFAESSDNMSLNDLKQSIESRLRYYLNTYFQGKVRDSITAAVNKKVESLCAELKAIIKVYAPDAALISADRSGISVNSVYNMQNISTLTSYITNQLNSNVLYVLIGTCMATNLWAVALIIILAELFGGRNWLQEKAKGVKLPKLIRRRCARKLLENKESFESNIRYETRTHFNQQTSLVTEIKSEIKELLNAYIKNNINYYKIPIE